MIFLPVMALYRFLLLSSQALIRSTEYLFRITCPSVSSSFFPQPILSHDFCFTVLPALLSPCLCPAHAYRCNRFSTLSGSISRFALPSATV
ncbi:hypothetical protein C8R45DRAFT_1029067 [Mycena sanguinolenta]|nr:hypothetical protein C8R45DRAFT_1029067 [Mycena sanguinolenta]